MGGVGERAAPLPQHRPQAASGFPFILNSFLDEGGQQRSSHPTLSFLTEESKVQISWEVYPKSHSQLVTEPGLNLP